MAHIWGLRRGWGLADGDWDWHRWPGFPPWPVLASVAQALLPVLSFPHSHEWLCHFLAFVKMQTPQCYLLRMAHGRKAAAAAAAL